MTQKDSWSRTARRTVGVLASAAVVVCFSSCQPRPAEGLARPSSLTGKDFAGKKYYLGFRETNVDTTGTGSMENEVIFDVKHTQDIFTKQVGGNYIGKEATSAEEVKSAWEDIGGKLTEKDMYVQYSSGHGGGGGLGIGLTWTEIRDTVLSYKAQELIVFLMSCESGNLVDSVNEKKSTWQDWGAQGRTLFVMTSSSASQSSSSGPGTDDDEPAGKNGSAGSAFGYALWKSLIGYADGDEDGVRDGFISLGEIVSFATKKTREVGGHTPQVTGVFNPNLIMNLVPPKTYLSTLHGGTEGLDDAQVKESVQAADDLPAAGRPAGT